MKVFRIIMIMIIILVSKMVYSRVYFPFFNVITEELCVPASIDTLEMTVDSIMGEFEKKNLEDKDYFYNNHFNGDEDNVLSHLQSVSHIWIEGWADGRFFYTPRRKRLENIADYCNLRDWYHANKDSINWFFDAELAMVDMGFHLKRDSTGVYAERDSTTLH